MDLMIFKALGSQLNSHNAANVFLVIPENLISGIWSVTNDKSDSIFILIPDKLEEHRMVNRKLFWQKYSIFKVLP